LLRGEAKAIDKTVAAPADRATERHLPLFGARRMGLRRLCKLTRLDSLKTRV
jgi:hypothetical protein